jgi:hypothetical protein
MDQFLTKTRSNDYSLIATNKQKLDNELDICNRRVFGNDVFRPRQKEIVEEVMKGSDVFVIMPTGSRWIEIYIIHLVYFI